MVDMSLTLVEARARAALISAISYDIELDLSAGRTDDGGGFACRTSISFRSTGPETFLDLANASDLRLSVNGKDRYDDVRPTSRDAAAHATR